MAIEDWIWMPRAGHFICGFDCRFHMTTYVNRYIVSTIGEYWPDSEIRKIHAECRSKVIIGKGDDWDRNYFKEFGYNEIGIGMPGEKGPTYETMVFKAMKAKDYEGETPYYVMSNGDEFECKRYYKSHEAREGHYKMCKICDEKD